MTGNGKATVASAQTAGGTNPVRATPAIEVRGLFKRFEIPGDRPATLQEQVTHPFRRPPVRRLDVIRDISFEVMRNEFFGIVGRNGSGKSTLLKLLASIYRADRGRIRVAGTISPIIELGIGFQADMSARDNVITNALMLGLTPREARKRFDAVIEFAELNDFVDLKLRNYSSGMRARLAFAIAIQTDPDILLLDEVLAVGDPPFQERCRETFAQLKQQRKSTIVLVTHSAGLITRYCDRAMMLEAGRIDYIGEPSGAVRRYKRLAGDAGVRVDEYAPARVAEFSLLGRKRGTAAVGPGKPFRLRFALEADEPVDEPRLRVWITADGGVKVFTAPPFRLRDSDVERLGAGERVRVAAEIENKLAAGRYRLGAMLVSGRGDNRAHSEVATLDVEVQSNGQTEGGLVSLDYEIRTQPSSGTPRR